MSAESQLMVAVVDLQIWTQKSPWIYHYISTQQFSKVVQGNKLPTQDIPKNSKVDYHSHEGIMGIRIQKSSLRR